MIRLVFLRLAILILLALIVILCFWWYQERVAGRTWVNLDGEHVSFRLSDDWRRAADKEKPGSACFVTEGERKILWLTCIEDDESSPEEMCDSIALSLAFAPGEDGYRFVDIGKVARVPLWRNLQNAGFIYRIERKGTSGSGPLESWHWHMIVRHGSRLYKLGAFMLPNLVEPSAPIWFEKMAEEFEGIFSSLMIESAR